MGSIAAGSASERPAPSRPASSSSRPASSSPIRAVGLPASEAESGIAASSLGSGDVANNEYPVSLDDLRERLPDNLYWRFGAPTKDPQILRARAEDEKRWNERYGKVLSNTASEAEVRAYYDHRRQLSEDYIEFATLVLKEYGERLPDRDQRLYELSIELHSARLAEIPRQIADALERKKAQDRRREEWRSDHQ
ncbi:MAG: hypothetical protein MJE77_04180 [Proteobacteria bacterium]|nr:hypothetical protein [Pseudomonadota bacterium]